MTVSVRPLIMRYLYYCASLTRVLRCIYTLYVMSQTRQSGSGELVFLLESRRLSATLNTACPNKLWLKFTMLTSCLCAFMLLQNGLLFQWSAQCALVLTTPQYSIAHDSIYSLLYAIAHPSVCPSHGWISQKRLKLGSCSFYHRVAPWL